MVDTTPSLHTLSWPYWLESSHFLTVSLTQSNTHTATYPDLRRGLSQNKQWWVLLVGIALNLTATGGLDITYCMKIIVQALLMFCRLKACTCWARYCYRETTYQNSKTLFFICHLVQFEPRMDKEEWMKFWSVMEISFQNYVLPWGETCYFVTHYCIKRDF